MMIETPEFDLTAARFVLGAASSDDLVLAANQTIERGVVTPALVELISAGPAIMSDVAPLFEMVAQELDKELPSVSDATLAVIRHHVESIAQGRVAPRKAMRALLYDVQDAGRSSLKSVEYVGDSHDLQDLIGSYYGFDDLDTRPDEVSFEGKQGREAVEALEAHLVKLACAWLEKHMGERMHGGSPP